MVLNKGTYRFALNADGTCCAFVLVIENAFAKCALSGDSHGHHYRRGGRR